MENKTKQFHFRVTPSQYEEIRKRSVDFQSISHFINSAIDEFSNDTYKIKRDTRRQLIDYYSQANLHLSHLGGNLNQAMHHINAMAQSGIDVRIAFGQEVLPLIIKLQSSILQLQSELRLITDKLRSIR